MTRVKVGLELSEEFEVKVGVHQGTILSPMVFAIVVDMVSENVRNGLMSEMLNTDDLVLTSKTMEGLREKFWKWKEALEGEVSVSKVDPFSICGKRVMANSELCVKCRKWIHGRCGKVQMVTPRLGRDFVCGRCKKQVHGLVEPVEEFCEEVEKVRGFCYLGDRENVSGGWDTAVTARIGWVNEVQGMQRVTELTKRF